MNAPASVVRTLHGRVLNGPGGSGVARALVRINGRAVLTDAEGKFEFPAFTDAQAFVNVTKPGFSSSSDPTARFRQQRIVDLDAPLECILYPDAVVTGLVTGTDGLPVGFARLQLQGLNYDVSGTRWVPAPFRMTDSHGEYRMVVPAGQYRLALGFTPRLRETGYAVSPVSFPETPPGGGVATFSVSSGEERHIDLRARTGPAYPVDVAVEPADTLGRMQWTANSVGGETFFLPAQVIPGGEFRFSLPAGDYGLHVQSQDRDNPSEASMRLTVPNHAIKAGTMHLVSEMQLGVEISAEAASLARGTTNGVFPATPNPQQLNLYFRNLAGTGDGQNADVRPQGRPDQTSQFILPAGHYRLEGRSGGAWYIISATYGTENLLRDDVTVGSGAASGPLRIVVGNLSGNIRGTVPETSSGTAFVYLIPLFPAISPYILNVDPTTRTFSQAAQPGTYSVVAVEHALQVDFRDTQAVNKVSAGARTIDIPAGSDLSVDLSFSVPSGGAR